ncbi:hypothetical protein FKW77_003661 [Venturia effusa]|uniref:Uncharacterized protein n=1 Tax=Venturia effusa TaxID=50376 RepID=A0A517KW29_9PEZI|nr:hypothetical protein FKW77_003661 [Venturia effusa]
MAIRKTIQSQPFLIMATVLSGILSVVVIGLTADIIAWVRTSGAQKSIARISYNVTMNGTELAQSADIAVLPLNLHLASYWLMLATGVCGLFDAVMISGIMCWRRIKSAEMQVENGEVSHFTFVSEYANEEASLLLGTQTNDRNLCPQTPLTIAFAAFDFCISIATAIYAWVDWSASGTFDPSSNLNLNSRSRYVDNFFTPDRYGDADQSNSQDTNSLIYSFFCQLEDYISLEAKSDYLEDLCREGTGARTISLAVAVLSAFVLYGVLYRTYRRSQRAKAPGAIPYPPSRPQSALSDARTIVASDEKTTPMSEK